MVKKSLLIWYALARMRKPLTLHGPILFILTGLAWKTSKAFVNLHHRHLFKVFVLLSLEGHSGGVSHEVLSAFEIFFIIFFSHHKLSLKKLLQKKISIIDESSITGHHVPLPVSPHYRSLTVLLLMH